METDNIIEIKSDDNWYITYRDIVGNIHTYMVYHYRKLNGKIKNI